MNRFDKRIGTSLKMDKIVRIQRRAISIIRYRAIGEPKSQKILEMKKGVRDEASNHPESGLDIDEGEFVDRGEDELRGVEPVDLNGLCVDPAKRELQLIGVIDKLLDQGGWQGEVPVVLDATAQARAVRAKAGGDAQKDVFARRRKGRHADGALVSLLQKRAPLNAEILAKTHRNARAAHGNLLAHPHNMDGLGRAHRHRKARALGLARRAKIIARPRMIPDAQRL